MYQINSFITRVDIEMILSINPMNIVSFDPKHSRNKRKTAFKGTNIREDVRSNAIIFANDHIQMVFSWCFHLLKIILC